MCLALGINKWFRIPALEISSYLFVNSVCWISEGRVTIVGGLLSYNKGQREPMQGGHSRDRWRLLVKARKRGYWVDDGVCVKLQGGKEMAGVAGVREREGAWKSWKGSWVDKGFGWAHATAKHFLSFHKVSWAHTLHLLHLLALGKLILPIPSEL